MEREMAPLHDAGSLLALRDCFRRYKFDVVHTHTPKAGLIGPLAAQLAGVPHVVHTIHGLLFHDRMSRWRQAFFWLPEKFTARCCDHLLSQSQEDIERAIRSRLCAPKKIMYLGNGINVEYFAPRSDCDRGVTRRDVGIADHDFLVGSVGRLVKEKGFMELFTAAEKLSARCPQIKFLVIGPREADQNDALDPSYMDEFQRRGIVRFVNWAEDLRHWYTAMDVFVLPSYREGIPRACMEAAAMTRPVIASDIRGCREVVLNGETGFLIPPGDSASLARTIERLYEDRELTARMGERAREHIVKNFNNKDVCSRLCEF